MTKEEYLNYLGYGYVDERELDYWGYTPQEKAILIAKDFAYSYVDERELDYWGYTPQEKASLIAKKSISQSGRAVIWWLLKDVSIRFYDQVHHQFKIKVESLAKEVYKDRYGVKRGDEFHISEIDFLNLFLTELAGLVNVRKGIEETHERERDIISGDLRWKYMESIKGRLENNAWATLKTTINAELDAKSRFAARIPEEITRDVQIEMVEQDYVDAYFLGVDYVVEHVQKESFSAVYNKYRNKVKMNLSNADYDKFNIKEWYQFVSKYDIYHSEGSEYEGIDPHKLYSNSEITENIVYWGEREIYESLKENLLSYFGGERQLDKVRYTVQSLLDHRTPEEIERDDKALVTVEDYFNWCMLVWKDIDYSESRAAENEQYNIEEEYYTNNRFKDNKSSGHSEYGGPPDGYGGRLGDDYIDDVLGGQPDAHWNLD